MGVALVMSKMCHPGRDILLDPYKPEGVVCLIKRLIVKIIQNTQKLGE